MIEEMKREFEEKFYLWKQLRIDGTFESCNNEVWNWFEPKLKQEIEEERNVGAKLMAERILNELKNPSGGKFGCEEANQIIDYLKQELESAKQQGWEAGYDEAVDTHDRITTVQLESACKKQREICAEEYDKTVEDITNKLFSKLMIKDYILNAPSPLDKGEGK